MKVRWCGVTSALTRVPSALARRTSSTDRAVLRWHRWIRPPQARATARSRATAISSASAGLPGQPERGRVGALVHVPALGEGRILGVVGEHHVAAERLGVHERVAQDPRVRHAAAVVAEHPDAGLDHLADLRELAPPPSPFVIAPTGNTSHEPAAAARSRTSCTIAAWSATGSVFAIAAIAV